MKTVRQIWADYVQGEEYKNAPENRYWVPEAQKQQLYEILGDDGLKLIEDVVMSVACDAEEKGFLQGFKMAMAIREECMQ